MDFVHVMTNAIYDESTKSRLDRSRRRESKALARVIRDDPTIFRAVRPGTLLEFGGHWLRTGPITDPVLAEKGYGRSFQVERLASFLSHSWHAPPIKKVLALYAHLNAPWAVFWGLLIALLLALLQLFGRLPPLRRGGDGAVVELIGAEPAGRFDIHASVFLGYACTYFSCLLFWSQAKSAAADCARRRFRRPGLPTGGVFLDKLCIHQTDADMKQKGILAIGSYLSKCDEMLVAWDATYFTRLWCVFELCIFLAINPEGRLTFVPIDWYAMETFAGIGTCCIAALMIVLNFLPLPRLIMEAAGTRLGWGAIFAALSCPLFCCVVFTMRKMTHTRIELFREIRDFKVSAAKCFMESDRQFVVDQIRNLYGDERLFEDYVKGTLGKRLSYQLGSKLRIPYFMLVRCVMPFWVLFALDVPMGLTDWPSHRRWHWFAGQSIVFFMQVPLLITGLEQLCYTSLTVLEWWTYDGWGEVLCAVAAGAVSACAFGAWAAFIWPLTVQADVGFKLGSFAVCFFGIVLGWLAPFSRRVRLHTEQIRKASLDRTTKTPSKDSDSTIATPAPSPPPSPAAQPPARQRLVSDASNATVGTSPDRPPALEPGAHFQVRRSYGGGDRSRLEPGAYGRVTSLEPHGGLRVRFEPTGLECTVHADDVQRLKPIVVGTI